MMKSGSFESHNSIVPLLSSVAHHCTYEDAMSFRYFSTEYLASYRSLTATYYPEYAASAHAAAGYIGNGYFDVALPRSLTSIPY